MTKNEYSHRSPASTCDSRTYVRDIVAEFLQIVLNARDFYWTQAPMTERDQVLKSTLIGQYYLTACKGHLFGLVIYAPGPVCDRI